MTLLLTEFRTNLTYWLLAIVFVLASWSAPVRGADIHLRANAVPGGRVVTLGDVADIQAASDAERAALASVELIPTPAVPGERSLKLREVQDLLELRGIATGEHRFSGASEVRLGTSVIAAAGEPRKFRANGSTARGANAAMAAAISKHLARSVDADRDWQVNVELTEEQVRKVQGAFGRITIEGGVEPWHGPQQFNVYLGAKEAQFVVDVDVQHPDMVVVAARPLTKGDVIRTTDLTLEPAKRGAAPKNAFRSSEEIVGQEAVRSIAAGQVLDANYIRPSVLVKRGDVVTVYAYSSGVRVKTTGRSRQAGGKGELVEIESLTDRSRFFAVVADVQVVEVYASAAKAMERIAER